MGEHKIRVNGEENEDGAKEGAVAVAESPAWRHAAAVPRGTQLGQVGDCDTPSLRLIGGRPPSPRDDATADAACQDVTQAGRGGVVWWTPPL